MSRWSRDDQSERVRGDVHRSDDVDVDEATAREARESLQERLSAWLDLPLAILALIWTLLVVAELAIPVSPATATRIAQTNLFIWFIFAADFLVELALATDKGRYLRTHVLAAVAVVLPFFRVVRILQFARLLRATSLVRFVVVANRATGAAAEVFSQNFFGYVMTFIGIVILLGAAGVFFFERGVAGTSFTSYWESLWWTAAMITTINVGTEPVTLEGRIIALLLRVVAAAVFGYVTASIASFLVERRVSASPLSRAERAESELSQLRLEVERLQSLVDDLTAPRDPSRDPERSNESNESAQSRRPL